MHTPETEHETPGLGATVKSVSERASSLVRLELELAALEVKRKIASLGIGIGLATGVVEAGIGAAGRAAKAVVVRCGRVRSTGIGQGDRAAQMVLQEVSAIRTFYVP